MGSCQDLTERQSQWTPESITREGSTVTLYLDKGSADQLRSGMMGTILDGPEGDKPFEGGSFSIAQVVGGSKSIAKSSTLQKPVAFLQSSSPRGLHAVRCCPTHKAEWRSRSTVIFSAHSVRD